MISLLFLACSSGPIDAPPYAVLEFKIPDDNGYEVLLSSDEQDIGNMGRVLPFSVMVRLGEENVPEHLELDNTTESGTIPAVGMENIKVELLSKSTGLYIIPSLARQVEDTPWSEYTGDDWTSICTVDGNFVATEDWCLFTYVDENNVYTDYNHLANYYRDGDNDDVNDADPLDVQTPNYYIGTTDNRGLLSGWIFIDYFEGSSDGDLQIAQLQAFSGAAYDVLDVQAMGSE
jgi:hypothetical protein